MVGGLIGHALGVSGIPTTISKCYATGNITATPGGSGTSYPGGLVGALAYTTLSESWALGNVYARARPDNTGQIYAGGLAGGETSGAKIANCYALGDVFVDNPYSSGGSLVAGGLVGLLNNGSDGVYYSFAKGSVTAQSNATSTARAAGLVGHRNEGAIENCVALGENVITKGGSFRAAARIYGYPATAFSGDNGSSSGNYAMSLMYLEIWDKYRDGTYGDGGTITVVSPTSTAAGPHGESVAPGSAAGALGTAAFWTSTTDGPGFDPSIWNMNGVARDYPKLANAGGQ
jgi:hypothetical protein